VRERLPLFPVPFQMAKKLIPLAGYISAKFIPSSVTASQIEAIPPYPDVGIEFKGYAKKLGTGGYTLLKQENYQLPMAFSWTTSNAPLTLSVQPRDRTDIYINQISFSGFSDTNVYINLYESPSNKLIARFALQANAGGSMAINLIAPYKMKDVTFGIQPSTPITGTIVANIAGWYETTA